MAKLKIDFDNMKDSELVPLLGMLWGFVYDDAFHTDGKPSADIKLLYDKVLEGYIKKFGKERAAVTLKAMEAELQSRTGTN